MPNDSAILIHGIDGTTYPQLLDSGSLSAFISESQTLEFPYSPAKVAGEFATEQTVSQVATELLDLLKRKVVPTILGAGDTNRPSIMFFAYDLGGILIKEVAEYHPSTHLPL